MCQKVLDCACVASKKDFNFSGGAISNPSPDNFWRRSAQGTQVVEIRVFGDNSISFAFGKGPNVHILRISKPMKGHMAGSRELILNPSDQLARQMMIK